ncbi:Ig-like domain-containing protein [Bacillus solimangrovi]|uniref:SbsA Ig-like domain-containing protein n=1 Tax=Bacillus solimangrovi TaxID=1305675 RepID=A0A1E5LDK1_9BACI|nr:Ig-like domain-containing protein [Bacillus solimangrovi]OEH92165.1 hypothetical protein BFG57_02530 [Bacillus solimangrovi]
MNFSNIFSKISILFICSMMFFSIFFSFSQSTKVIAANNARIKDSSPRDGSKQVPVDIEPTITFNDKVLNVHENRIELKLKKSNNKYEEIELKEIRKSGEKLIIVPEDKLEFNKKYVLEIDNNAVELKNGYYRNSRNIDFETNYIDFYDLMVVNDAKLSSILETYTPRELRVIAPDRYIEEISVLHKKRGKVEDDTLQQITDSLTNIDIVTEDTYKVKRVYVKIKYQGHTMHSGNAIKVTDNDDKRKKGKDLYTLGFGNLPPAYDVIVISYNSKNEEVDKQTIKVAANDKLFQEIKETYKYKTAGESFTLYELLDDDKKFNDLLTENDMKKLKVQVDD